MRRSREYAHGVGGKGYPRRPLSAAYPQKTDAVLQRRGAPPGWIRCGSIESAGTTVIHVLKTHRDAFVAVKLGIKRFEFRKDDRGYAVGDELRLREWDQDERDYTGREVTVSVSYLLRDRFGMPPGYVCMSIEPVRA